MSSDVAVTTTEGVDQAARGSQAKPRDHDPRWLVPALALFTIAATVKLGIRQVSDPDTWWHLKTGAYVLSGGSFNGPDPWVPFSSRPFVLTQWLPEVVAQKGYALFGLPAVAWLRAVAMLALISALVWAARQAADAVPAIMAALAGLIGTGGSLSERPQLVSFVLLAVTVGAWWKTETLLPLPLGGNAIRRDLGPALEDHEVHAAFSHDLADRGLRRLQHGFVG